MSDIPHEAIQFLYSNAKPFGIAKGQRVGIENTLRHKKALLMRKASLSGFTTTAAQEREAYADLEYFQLIEGLEAATIIEETLLWQMKAAQMRIEVWKTESYVNRQVEKSLS